MPKGRILFIAQHRPDRSPSQRFRFEQYLDSITNAGYEYDYSYLINEEDDRAFYSVGNVQKKAAIVARSFKKRQADLKRADDYDIIFVQREAFMTGTTFFERKFAKSKAKLVFDFDDSIWLQNVSDANKRLNFLKNPQKTSRIISLADHVIAGNDYLADYARQFNPNVSIIPTTIDTDAYRPLDQKFSRDEVVIGWSGSITTIQHFNHAIPVLLRVKEKYGDHIRIHVIGDPNYKNDELGVQGIAWNSATEIADLMQMDIGIMPLPDDEWAKGKCGLKGLQYMALGIPTMMSPVGVNGVIIQDGENGFLAATEDEWFEKLCRLIDDANLRKSVGDAGMKTVEEKYSVKANKASYLNLFDRLLSS